MDIKTSRLSRPRLLHLAARYIKSFPPLMLLAGICLAPACAIAQSPPFPYSGNVTPIILDDPLTEGMRLNLNFTLTVPIPAEVSTYTNMIVLDYVNPDRAVVALDTLEPSAFKLTDDQPSLYTIFTRFFSGKALPRSKLSADAIRYLEEFFRLVSSDIGGSVSHWQHDAFDVYMYQVSQDFTLSGGDMCIALILNRWDKRHVVKVSAMYGIKNTDHNTRKGQAYCDSLKSIIATIEDPRH